MQAVELSSGWNFPGSHNSHAPMLTPARGSCRALVGAGEAGGDGVRALLARQRSAGALGAVRARLAGDTRLFTLASLVRACLALVARGHARVWRDRAGAALTRLRRARTARRSWRALQAVVRARHREVELQHRLVLVAACLARQRGRRALRAVRAGRAGLALETNTHARVECDCAGAAGRLLGAARWRKVARVGIGALVGAGEASGDGVRALRARQRRAGTLGAVRARLAGDARLLAFALLVRACRALVARALAGVGLDGAGAALGLLGAARRREVARAGSRALGSGAKVGHVGVCALAARQRCRRALGAVRAWHAHVALGLAGLVHELARAALGARGLLVQWLHGTLTTQRLLSAARWREVARVGLHALTAVCEACGAGVRAGQAWEGDGGALGTVMALQAGCRRYRFLYAAREASGAKPCTCRARLLAGSRSIAAHPSGRTYTVLPSRVGFFCQSQGWLKVVGLQELDVTLQLSTLSMGLILQLSASAWQAESDERHASRQTSHLVAGTQ
eukprot:scaffold14805_cov68-Phaeocystis_antarctica.AAC.4